MRVMTMDGTEVEGDIEAFIRSLESGVEEKTYTKREKMAELDDMKVRCWITSLNYGSGEETV